MIGNFTEVKPLCYWVQHILPLVYDDSLSYMELLAKVTKLLNELVENNNKLPDYIMKLIKEYISSGEIEKVIAEVLANYMLNVKFPPSGLTPAIGDGSADDTDAIQGCIDYAFNNGGMSVFFPSGSYLTQPLTLRNKATLFGQDRYSTRLVMKGGAKTAMFTGDVDELTLSGLGFDGNMDIQVNNVNLFTISVNSAIISNCLLTDGYDLLNITVNNDLQLNNILFRHAVENALVLNGTGIVQAENLIFKSVSTLVGKNFVVMGVSKSILEQIRCYGASPNGVLITGNNNVVKLWNEQSLTPYVDNGNNNSITVYTQTVVEKLTGSKTAIIGGNVTETIIGNKEVSAHDITETATGARTENTTGNRNETTDGNATETITGSSTETVTGDKEVSAQNYNETVRGNKTTTTNKSTENVTTDKELNANVSREILGTKTVNVSGVSTENLGSKNETIEGDKTVTAANSIEKIEGDKTVNAGDITNNATNITVHATQDFTEQTDADRTINVTGTNNESVGEMIEIVNGIKKLTVKGDYSKDIEKNQIATIVGNKTETINGISTNTSQSFEFNSTLFSINSSEPLKYSKEPKNFNRFFDYIPMNYLDTTYSVLVGNSYKGDIINVRDYGAIGNGISDDLPAFKSAVNACKKNDTLFVPPGEYFWKYTNETECLLNVNKNIIFQGVGGSTFIRYDRLTPTNVNVINWSVEVGPDNQFGGFRDFSCQYSGLFSADYFAGQHLIYINEVDPMTHISFCTISGLRCIGISGYGVYLDNPTGRDGFFISTITNCLFYSGIYLDGSGDSVYITFNNFTKGNDNHGIYVRNVTGSASTIILGNNLTSPKENIFVNGGEQTKILFNQIEQVSYTGIMGASVALTQTANATFSNNNVNARLGSPYCLNLIQSSNINISENVFTNFNDAAISVNETSINNNIGYNFYSKNGTEFQNSIYSTGKGTTSVNIALKLSNCNPYSVENFGTPSFYKENNKLYFKGVLQATALGAGTIFFTIPEGYRPKKNSPLSLSCTINDNDVSGIVIIVSSTGEGKLLYSKTALGLIYLDGGSIELFQ